MTPAPSLAGPLECAKPPSAPGWPVVVYFHRVDASIDHYTALTPTSFTRALDLLRRSFPPLDPRRVTEAAATPEAGESRFLVTIDDGWRDGLMCAAPLLEERGLRAIFFVPTAAVGEPGRLSWDELGELRERGHLVASHGHEHRRLDRLDRESLASEVSRSFSLLRERVGEAPPMLAFPYGQVPDRSAVPDALTGILRFGTVKSRARPWPAPGGAIRRTYLPTDRQSLWPELVEGWCER